jgi:hypothetical protein
MSTPADGTNDSPTEWIDVHVAGGTGTPSTPVHGSPSKQSTPAAPTSRSLPKPIPPVTNSLASAAASAIASASAYRPSAGASKDVDESFHVDSLRREMERLRGENTVLRHMMDVFNKKETELNKRIVDLEVQVARHPQDLKNQRDQDAKLQAAAQAAAVKKKEDDVKAASRSEKDRLLKDLHRRQNYRAN